MSGTNKFLSGCTAGVMISLIAVCVIPAARRRALAARKGPLRQTENPPAEPGLSERPAAGLSRRHIVDASEQRSKFPLWITAAGAVVTLAAVFFGASLWTRIRYLDAQLARMSEDRLLDSKSTVQPDQRAWVGLVEATPQPLTGNGGGFTVKLQNMGGTDALDVQISGAVTLEEMDETRDLPEPTIRDSTLVGSLMAGATYTTEIRFQTSPDAASKLAHNQLRAVSFVRVAYRDVAHRLHVSRSCFYWHSGLSSVKSCNGDDGLN